MTSTNKIIPVQSQINLSKSGNMCTATQHRSLITLSSSSHQSKKEKGKDKSSQVTKETSTKTSPQTPSLLPQSRTTTHKGQTNLSEKGNMCTATTRHSQSALKVLSVNFRKDIRENTSRESRLQSVETTRGEQE